MKIHADPYFSFNFVNKNNGYIITPYDINIYGVSNGSTLAASGPVLFHREIAKPNNSSALLRNYGQDQS